MIKYKYKVLKPFTLYREGSGEQKIARMSDSENRSGSRYTKTTDYFDYCFKEDGLTQSDVTKKLLSLKYIKLVGEC